MNKNNPTKNILLVHLFSNGDCLYATAIARQIKKDYPDCTLTWAISESCKAIIDNNPYVDEISVLNNIPKNDLKAFRKVKKEVLYEKTIGKWQEVFITQNMDENQAYYDGCIRSGILRAYPHSITEGLSPVLRLTDAEKKRINAFAEEKELKKNQFNILFEFAPQSGQLPISKEFAIKLAEDLVKTEGVAIILSSASKINHTNSKIIDGSCLTLRETAGLTFFCTLLIGCSSGITWASTSDGAKMLPMIQLVDPNAPWINPVSRDFERNDIPTNKIIDIITFDADYIKNCIFFSLKNFEEARVRYNQNIPLQFLTSRRIVYNLLTQLQFNYILKHISINVSVYGHDFRFYNQVFLALVTFPFKLLRNTWKKKVLNQK